MSTINLSGKGYSVTPQAEAFLKNYLERVRRYVAENGISAEYSQDIENRLAEKLSYVGTECQEGEAVRIVNELGEPEDAFADVPKSRKSGMGDFAGAMKDGMKSPLYRDSSKGIVFGVCAGLGDKFDVDPFFIRLLFVFLFFFYGTGVLAYLVLAILMKDKSKISAAGNGTNEAPQSASKTGAEGLPPIAAKVSEAIGGTFALAWSVAAFFFFGFLAFGLFATSLGFLAAFGISASGIVIENQNLFGGAHGALSLSAGIMGATLFALSWIAAFRAFGKKLVTGWALAVAGILIAGSLVAGAYGTFKTVANFAERQKTESVADAGISTGSVSIEFGDSATNRGRKFPELPKWTEIRVVKADSGTVKVKAVTEISTADQKSAETQFANIDPVAVTVTGGVVKIESSTVRYSRVSPYAFAKRTIEISVPKTVKLKIGTLPRYANFDGIAGNDLASFAYANERCTGLEVKYSEEAGAFICDPASYSPKAVELAKANYLESVGYRTVGGDDGTGGRYRYGEQATVNPLPDGTFRVSYATGKDGSESGTGQEIAKIFRVDVDPSGNFVKTEISGK